MAIFEKLPYTNYHDLNADWIVKKVKEVADAWTEYRDDMDEWKDGVDAELQTFYNWFDNLDLTDEVRTIIEEMVQDGTFITTATPVITSATETWLAAHVSQGYAVDNTLTISGAAADAKVTGDRISQLKEDLTAIAIRPTVSGSIASFTDGAEDVPMKSLVVNIEPAQSGSGDPSPSNIRPISGWSAVNTVRCGTNIFNGTWLEGYWDVNTGDFVSSGSWRATPKYKANVGDSFYVAKDGSEFNASGRLLFFSGNAVIDGGYTRSHFTIPSGYNGFAIYTGTATIDGDFTIAKYTGTPSYENIAYNGNTYTTALGQTVYGGKLDMVSGELVIDRECSNLGSFTWRYETPTTSFPYGYFYADVTGKANGTTNFITSIYPVIPTLYGGADKSASGQASGARIFIADSSYTDPTAFTTAVTGQTIVYSLATPITVQLTAQEVTSLLGANNVFADAGSVDVTYCADGKLYIDNRIAELQALVLEQ